MSEQLFETEAAPIGLEPVELLLQQEHEYEKKPKRWDPKKNGGRGGEVQPAGCVHCNGAQNARAHLGCVPSFNDGGSGMDRMAYQTLKKAWQWAWADALQASGLPRGLHSVHVEFTLGFQNRQGRDEDNFRWFFAKCLGDALQRGYDDDKLGIHVPGGWLEKDTFWPERRYTVGNPNGELAGKGRTFTRALLFPFVAG